MSHKQSICQEIKNLILVSQRQGSYYIAQTILGEIDELLKKIRYIPFIISLRKIKKKIVNTDTKKTNLKDIYEEILYILNKYKKYNKETLKLKMFIKALLNLEA